MAEDLYAATKYKLRVTQSFKDINTAVKLFKEKYSSTPWLRKSNSRYPNYFDDKPEWRRNGKLFINNHDFGIAAPDPVLEDGVNRNSSKYGGSFIGNNYIKYWWPDSSYPNDSGKWWYKKEKYSKPGDPPSATPGVSNHGWGISIDLHQDIFNNKKAVDWMANNMLNYGWATEELSDDQWHITYYIVAFATPLVTDRLQKEKNKPVIQTSLKNTNPSVMFAAQKTVAKTATIAPVKLDFAESATPNFSIPFRKNTTPIQTGGGAFGRQATVVGSKFAVLPGLKNLDGLSPKIFKVAQPYGGSSNPGDYLTYDEFFEMMIHPLVGNFSFGLAAVFTAIASREGNLGENKIGIGVANGSEHLGFLQLRCKPEDTEDFSEQTGWIGKSMLWSVPYNINGEPLLFNNNKKYAWEAFIKDENIIKEIKAKASSSSAASRKSAASLVYKNTPEFNGNYNEQDRKNASSYLADWARIPANQVWMMKSRFTLTPNYLDKQTTNIILPYLPQPSVLKPVDKPWNIKGIGFLFNPWNVGGENTWKDGADVNVAFNVLVNWFKKYGMFSEADKKPTTAQAKTRALQELNDLASYMQPGKKSSFLSWLSGISS